MPGFVEEVLANADEEIDFHERDANGDWIYDKNEDNVIDVVALFSPPEFVEAGCPFGKALKFDLPQGVEYETKDTGPDGTPLLVRRVIVSTVALLSVSDPSWPLMVGIMAHEYSHLMGLPDFYFGIDAWGLMGRGARGWLHNSDGPYPDLTSAWDGPTTLSAWSQMFVGWITSDTVHEDMLGIQIPYINSDAGKALKIPVPESDTEYFLVANRQNTHSEKGVGSYYDDYAPASGLAIWHVDEDMTPSPSRSRKFIDLECADGLFSNTGDANSVDGFDDLDFTDRGNDATDLWDGETYTAFTPSTNPSTMGYAVFPDPNDPSKELAEQRVRTGIAVHNIQARSDGVMQADIKFWPENYWSGPIAEDTVWGPGIVTVGGDVTIRSGVTLTINVDTEVRFVANSDDTHSGHDTTLSELIVEEGAQLEATGHSIFPIRFRSSTDADELDAPEWYGFHVESGGHATLTDVTIRDAIHCIPTPANSAESLPDNLTLDNLTLINCGTPPTIEGDLTPEFPEDSTEPVAAYTAEDAEGDAVAWSLGTDADEGAFTLTSAGVLDFEEPPDFETLNGDSLFYVTVRATDRQEAFTDYPVTVTVRNVDEAGTVVLSPLPPEVDQELTAALEDVDGVLSVDGWTWQRAASATAEEEDWTIIAETDGGEPTNHYTPQLSDVGWVLQATAYYADGHGPNKSEVSAPTAAVIGPELVGPESLTFVEHGTFVEDGEAVVPTYTVSGVDGTATWSLDGTDAAAFELAAASGGVSLSFSSPPNYEDPTDTDKGGPNTYYVTVVATLTAAAETAENSLADLFAAFQRLSDDSPSAQASSSALTQAVVVTVENGDDPGVVELLPAGPPRVGHSLTARLVDEDEDLTDMVWTWLADGDVVRPASPSGETTDGYEPQPEDEGRALQTQVRYKDPFGAKTVVSAPTAAVLPAGVVSLSPNPPRLCQPVTAELSGPEEVTGETWTWERQRQGSDKWDLLWSSSSPDKTASDSDLAYLFSAYNRGSGKVSRYQPTEEDLDRVLRATVSWDGHEASDRAPVGASAPGLPRHLEGEGRAAKVVLSWRTPNNCGSAITGYEYQYRLAEETHYYHDDDRPWGEVGQGANRRLTAASYRRRDFLRMLAGGYDVGGHPEPFVTPEHGPNITVANNHQLPAVFGSVRAYFEAVSDGAFHLIAQTQTL